MLPFLQVGPLAVQVPGLVLLLGLWFGLSLAERHAGRFGVNANLLYNLVFVALIAGVIGARLAYVFRFPAAFLESPASLISLNPSLLDMWGGLATAVIAALAYSQRRELPFWAVLDALTLMLAVLAIAVGLANLASGAAFGAPTSLPWGIELWGTRRHPSQIYETAAAMLILWSIWPGRGGVRAPQAGETGYLSGRYFLSFIALSAAAHLILQAFRGDSILLPGGLRSVQVIAWLVLAASLAGLSKLRARIPA